LEDEEWDAIEGLVSALKILKDAMTLFSSNVPIVAAVIPAMDAIDETFTTGIINKQILSKPIRHALTIDKKTLNKYYTLTDESHIYRVAMVLHPSFKLNYFRKAGWMDSWIDKAVSMTQEHW
ncbi:hypothetical protein BT96DRAFT_748408, partial [Gymnopus androsaceus JB14]